MCQIGKYEAEYLYAKNMLYWHIQGNLLLQWFKWPMVIKVSLSSINYTQSHLLGVANYTQSHLAGVANYTQSHLAGAAITPSHICRCSNYTQSHLAGVANRYSNWVNIFYLFLTFAILTHTKILFLIEFEKNSGDNLYVLKPGTVLRRVIIIVS